MTKKNSIIMVFMVFMAFMPFMAYADKITIVSGSCAEFDTYNKVNDTSYEKVKKEICAEEQKTNEIVCPNISCPAIPELSCPEQNINSCDDAVPNYLKHFGSVMIALLIVLIMIFAMLYTEKLRKEN